MLPSSPVAPPLPQWRHGPHPADEEQRAHDEVEHAVGEEDAKDDVHQHCNAVVDDLTGGEEFGEAFLAFLGVVVLHDQSLLLRPSFLIGAGYGGGKMRRESTRWGFSPGPDKRRMGFA